MNVRVRVLGVPAWVDASHLLGPSLVADGADWVGETTASYAADLAARLHGVVLAGAPVTLVAEPPLPRAMVRAARTDEARRRRATTKAYAKVGVRLDETARLGWTPEALADAIAAPYAGKRVLDATAGGGGNTIAFARAGCVVTAVEQHAGRAASLRHNLAMYGVSAEIVVGDAFVEVPSRSADVLWLDPPWGEDYRAPCGAADLPLVAMLDDPAVRARYGAVLVKVPPAFDPSTTPWARPTAVFGLAEGDRRRVKMVILTG